jgi:acyl carrier protein
MAMPETLPGSDVNAEALPDGSPLIARIRRLFADVLYVQVPSADTDLIDAGLLDSLGLVELLVRLEETFGVEVPLDSLDIEDFRSLRSIGAYMVRCGVPRSWEGE